jgi:uncharacterized protein YdiU (UPF0061 family)
MKHCGFQFDNTYLNLPGFFYYRLDPSPVPKPKLIILNEDLATSIGLDFTKLSKKDQSALFAGNSLPKGSEPFSQAYAGHQFGYFTMLGDGRAHLLGEHITPDKKRLDIQFKGSGRTPYSRRGDGRAALGPMLREYIISEAMHHLGIPTTRSLAVVTTGERVIRETPLPGAILTRVASSHIRIGTFEFVADQRDESSLLSLLNYTVQRHYPHLVESENVALGLLEGVMEKQADLIVHWMRVGFIHGVMNTDNMTLSGETIDYGPCAFMDAYNPNTVFSSIDHEGRYAYANQPKIAQWNLARFAETLLPYINDDENKAMKIAEEMIHQFPKIYQRKWLTMMRSKLGLFGSQQGDDKLIFGLLNWIHKNYADYTNTFRDLSATEKPNGKIYQQKDFENWYLLWQERIVKNKKPLQSSEQLMKNSNPAVIPRNHKVEQVLEAAYEKRLQPLLDLLAAIKEPYKDREALKPYQIPPHSGERVYQTFCGT